MARVFITGSADGLGKMAAQILVRDGHSVVLHARNKNRGETAIAATPGAETVVIGDLSSIAETKKVAQQVNKLGKFDAVIHNAALGYREDYLKTSDNVAALFAVNSLAPYILTCLIHKPKRLVYISSGLHKQGDTSLKDLGWSERAWNGFNAYCDSKLHDALLAFAVARLWPDVFSNAVEPGWVATKMGGPGATDSLEEGPETQAWLAASNDPAATVSGKYFFHKQLNLKPVLPAVYDTALQQKLLQECEGFSGVKFPV
jgi:NAD(P)-dependent dehydrogenase (short-subunit alcohol dehydrogenase family)